MKSKSWWYSFFGAYEALHMVNAKVGSNVYTGTVVDLQYRVAISCLTYLLQDDKWQNLREFCFARSMLHHGQNREQHH